MAKEREKAAWRIHRDAQARTQLWAEIRELSGELKAQWRRLASVPPPLMPAALEGDARVAAFRQHEAEHRDEVDHALWQWWQYGQLGQVAPSVEYWLAARFEHAWWLAEMLMTQDPDGVLRYLPAQNGHLLKGYREWLLVHSWRHAGADRFFQ